VERPFYTVEELSEILEMRSKSILNAISAERFPIPTYKVGRHRVADREVVRQWFENQRAEGLSKITTNA